jgi:glycosyltransferase involved in cell wall biosynthesis
MANTLTAIVLTLNEAKHIERCLRSLGGVADRVIVVDSGSTDATTDLARALGAIVYFNPWVNYAQQFNWALEQSGPMTNWILRIDADEYLSDALRSQILKRLRGGTVDPDVVGFTVRRTTVFMGRSVRWGGTGAQYMLRLFRADAGRCEDRWMDEHIVLRDGRIVQLDEELIDDNLNNIGWWISKHNGYATREAIDLLLAREDERYGNHDAGEMLNPQARIKRLIKSKVYAQMPPGIRAVLYFLYRYVLRLGILDGSVGFTFCMMQALWYRMLVDVKAREMERRMHSRGISLHRAALEEYGVQLAEHSE